MSEILISLTGNQQIVVAFLARILLFSVFLKIFPTHFTLHLKCLKCLLHMDILIDPVGTVMFVK